MLFWAAKVFNFDDVQFITFSFKDRDFVFRSSNSLCPMQGQTDFLYSSKNIDLVLAFKHLTYFEFLLLLWCEVNILANGYLIFSAQLVEKTVICPIYCLCTFVEIQLAINTVVSLYTCNSFWLISESTFMAKLPYII